MTILKIKEASDAVGISKQTMYRHIKNGKVSVTRLSQNEKGVDSSELLRVFGKLEMTQENKKDSNSENLSESQMLLGEKIMLLQEKVKFLEELNEDLREDKRKLLNMLAREQRKTENLITGPVRRVGILKRLLGTQ